MIRNVRFAFVLLSLSLIACQNQVEPLPTAPSNFTVTAGDGQATLTWDVLPGQIYTAYYQVGSDVTPGNYLNMVTRITSPRVVTGLANQTQYAFILNASNHGSVPGPSTPVVTVTPSASGTTGGSWTVGASLTSRALRGIAFGVHDFVAVGDGGSVYVAHDNSNSSSGITAWTQGTGVAIASNVNISSVLYNGSAFIAMAADGTTMLSTDTVSWILGTPIPSGSVEMTSLAYGGGTYVAVGLAGTIYRNTTGLNSAWIQQVSGTTQDLYNVSYVNGLFIAVGKGGVLLTSRDGATWTLQNSSTIHNLYQAAYGANTFVAVGDSGTIISSPDGRNWALQANSLPMNLYAVAYGSGPKFVAVGAAGNVLSSPAGAEGTWTTSSAGANDLYSVVPAGAVFVAVGNNGANVSGK